jgi:hypothetical protein
MATIRLRTDADNSLNVYFAVWRSSDNLVFDFDDETFKAVGSATTPFLTATPNTDEGGGGRSHYWADLDLDLLGVADVFVQTYQRAGGSPNLLTDLTLNDPLPMFTAFGTIGAALGGRVTPALRREENRFDASFTLTADGQPVTLDEDWTATLTIRGIVSVVGDADANWFPDLDGTITADGRVEFQRSNPGFTGDRGYTARITLVNGSSTLIIEDSFVLLA